MIFEHPQSPTLKQKYRKVVVMNIFGDTAATLNSIAIMGYLGRKSIPISTPLGISWSCLKQQKWKMAAPSLKRSITWLVLSSSLKGCDKNTNLKCSCVSVGGTDLSCSYRVSAQTTTRANMRNNNRSSLLMIRSMETFLLHNEEVWFAKSVASTLFVIMHRQIRPCWQQG